MCQPEGETWFEKMSHSSYEMEIEESQQGLTLLMHLSLRPATTAPLSSPFVKPRVSFDKNPIFKDIKGAAKPADSLPISFRLDPVEPTVK